MFEKNIKSIDIQTYTVSLIILGVCLLRSFTFINNFSPVIALAIFGALHYKKKSLAYILPLASLWLSDLLINNLRYVLSDEFTWFYKGFFWQYISYLIIIFLCIKFNNNKINISKIFITAIFSSFIFFIISNFGYWLSSELYEKNLFGLIRCYIAAIPFYKGTILGALFYTPLFFSFYYLLQKKINILKIDKLKYE